MTHISRSAIVPYSAGEMFRLVADIPSYSQFLPWCGGARILEHGEDSVIAAIDITYGSIHKTFTTRNLLQTDKMMELHLLDGPFKYLHGYWRFTPLGDTGCRIALDLDFEVANRVLGLVLTPAFTNIANQMVDRFHQRATKLYGTR